MRRHALILIVALAVVAGAAGCTKTASSTRSGAPSRSTTAADDGADLVKQRCVRCHSLQRIIWASHDAAGWKDTVTRMREKNGAAMSDEDAATIIEFLGNGGAAKL